MEYFLKQKIVPSTPRTITYLVPICQATITALKGPKRRICGSRNMKHSATTRNQYASGLRRKTRRRDVNHNNVLHSSTKVLQNVSDVPSTVHTPTRASGEKAECRAQRKTLAKPISVAFLEPFTSSTFLCVAGRCPEG